MMHGIFVSLFLTFRLWKTGTMCSNFIWEWW